MIVARELSRDLQLVIASQPTRGVDVGSIEYIHAQVVKARDEGAAVLVVSTELDEVMALSDRVIVMFRGRIVANLRRDEDRAQRHRPVHGRSEGTASQDRDGEDGMTDTAIDPSNDSDHDEPEGA